ncbi:MAG TPA: amino acid adenylation domain-containing protein [Steroidobacteraceae bacterium]|jgi:amino acid adenylation domain-containing protein|nr:amino acid adenylation domain-containing protein [Steroidobacteraceae bacterium]
MTESETSRAAGADDLRRIASFNDTAAEFPHLATLGELIEARARQCPDAPAVLCEHDQTFGKPSLTYAELCDKVDHLARRLRDAGARPNDVIALMVERSFAMSIGILAIIRAGAGYLPMSPESPPDRAEYMLQEAGVAILLVHGKTAGKVSAFKGTVINLDDLSLYDGPSAALDKINGPQDLAYVIYTSGSTGRPKGVMIEHRSVVNRLHWMQRAYPIGADDVILQKTPYYFDVSVWELFWWALEGAQMCFLPPGAERNPMGIVNTIRKNRVTVLHFVPSMLSVFLEYLESKGDAAASSLASVRYVFCSGEALSAEHVKRFNRFWGGPTGARLINLYGPTEATVDVTYYDCLTSDDFNSVPIGRPIDNTKLYIIREGRQVAVGDVGELCLAGVGVARGYINSKALTDEKFTDNPANPGERIYRTGDIARWLPDGNVEYLGREDHQVKIRGLRIELGEIENTIRQYGGVVECVTVVKRYSETVILIVAYVVCRDTLQINELKAFLKTRLPDYMVPNHFQQIPEMPLTPSGKADRKALPEPSLKVRPT